MGLEAVKYQVGMGAVGKFDAIYREHCGTADNKKENQKRMSPRRKVHRAPCEHFKSVCNAATSEDFVYSLS